MRISRSVARLRAVSAMAASKIAAVAASGTATHTSAPVKHARIEARPEAWWFFLWEMESVLALVAGQGRC